MKDTILASVIAAVKEGILTLREIQEFIESQMSQILTLTLTGLSFSPDQFIGQGWGFWYGPAKGDGLPGEGKTIDQDDRAAQMISLDVTKIRAESYLKEGETSITGEERLARGKQSGKNQLGALQFLVLWLDYKTNKERSALEWLRKEKGITVLFFFGTVLRGPGGDRCVLYLGCYGGKWSWYCDWLGNRWDAYGPSAVLDE